MEFVLDKVLLYTFKGFAAGLVSRPDLVMNVFMDSANAARRLADILQRVNLSVDPPTCRTTSTSRRVESMS